MWNLESISIPLGSKNFQGFRDPNQDLYYSAERVALYGILDFGFVNRNDTQRISLADNNITTSILLDSIIVTAPGTTGDELQVRLYRDGQQIAKQKFTNNQMPLDHPFTVITPDVEVEVEPRYDSNVYMYFRPVHIIFRAVPNP